MEEEGDLTIHVPDLLGTQPTSDLLATPGDQPEGDHPDDPL
jgi:hypothetical protein